MTDRECLNEIAKITDALKLRDDITKKEAIEELKDASFNDIAEELWRYFNYVLDIKSVLDEMENGEMNTDQAAGYNMAVRDICNLRNDCEWPEDLEVAIDDFLEERGMRK